MGFNHNIHNLLENIGWKLFSDGVTVDMQEEVALEMFMTLKKIMEAVDDEEVPCLKFWLKNVEKVITYEAIGSFLGFKSNASEMVEVEDGELDEFWTKMPVSPRLLLRLQYPPAVLRALHRCCQVCTRTCSHAGSP